MSAQRNTPIYRAAQAMGGIPALARHQRVSQSNVWQWVSGHRRVPIKRCASIERATGVPCEVLRPDVTWIRNRRGAVLGYVMRLRGLKP